MRLLSTGAGQHTEYTRMLAEHGILGLIALFILIRLSLRPFLIRRPPTSKAVIVSFAVWSLLFMFHAATRLVAPCLLFGLAWATPLMDSETLEDG
jgi:hypothetical protein